MAGGRIDLTFHQDVEQVNDRRLHATPGKAVGGLQAQQAAPDDDGASAARR